MIEGHGNNQYNFGGKINSDFSSNIAFNNCSERIIEKMKECLNVIQNYPDPKAKILTEKLAIHHNVKSENILVVNGSAEAFYMVAHYLSRNEFTNTLIFTPSFAEYEDSCKLYNHNINYLPLESYSQIDYGNYSTVWIGSPNNPNGYRVKLVDTLKFCELNPNTYFVIDRAYNQLSASCEKELINEIPKNLILINSLTKSFGIPGIRLGYIIAEKSLIKKLEKLRAPWTVNALSLVVGEYIMDNYNELNIDINEILNESYYLQNKIGDIDGFNVLKSDCNFFLCEILGSKDVDNLHSYLVENHGILIRDASNFRGLTRKHFRVATQTREQNNKLIKALREWVILY